MDLCDIDISKILINKSVKNSYDLKYNGNSLVFTTPKIYMPFGYEEKFYNYYINFELYDVKKNKEIENFLDFLVNIEIKIVDLLGIDTMLLNSQVRLSDSHNPILYTKVNYRNKKIISSIEDEKGKPINFFNLEKDIFTKATLMIDKIWLKNNRYFFKYIIKDMVCYNKN